VGIAQVDIDDWGVIRQHELKEGGKDIRVSDENKKEFVQLKAKVYTSTPRYVAVRSLTHRGSVVLAVLSLGCVQFIMVDRKSEQLQAVATGFNSVLPLAHVTE
jgi:hypothetical protein